MAQTAAERSKAYRDAKRDGVTEETVTRVTKDNEPTVTKCKTCGGPVQHPKVVKCLTCCTGEKLPAPEPTPEPADAGPLSVYSDSRWEYLRSLGHVWDADRQLSTRTDGPRTIIGVTAPGDPGYKRIA